MGKRDPTAVFVGIEEWLGNILAIGNRGDDEFALGQGFDAMRSLDACKRDFEGKGIIGFFFFFLLFSFLVKHLLVCSVGVDCDSINDRVVELLCFEI